MPNMLNVFVNLASYLTLIIVIIGRYRPSSIGCFKKFTEKSSDSCLVLMNGPSLLSDLDKYAENNNFEDADCIVSNHFADTDYFEQFAPKVYVFSDPYFFEEDSSKNFKMRRDKTFENIVNNVKWKMVIYIPSHRDVYKFSRYFSSNSNISVIQFNGSGYPVKPSYILFQLWRFNICSPSPQNVLIHALYLTIQLKYKKIILAGANFSFHNSIDVDQHSNIFYREKKHMYGEERVLAYLDHKEVEMASVSTELCEMGRSFNELSSLKIFAKINKVEICNYTNYSYLDMFQRPKL